MTLRFMPLILVLGTMLPTHGIRQTKIHPNKQARFIRILIRPKYKKLPKSPTLGH